MIGCLRTRVRNQPIVALYFELENELKFYNLKACLPKLKTIGGEVKKMTITANPNNIITSVPLLSNSENEYPNLVFSPLIRKI